jgi:glutathione S-transferase
LQSTVPPSNAVLESARKALDDAWKILDAQLAQQPFIAGATLTMADIPFCYIVNRWHKLPIERSGLTHVKAWYERLCERPAFRRNVYEVG